MWMWNCNYGRLTGLEVIEIEIDNGSDWIQITESDERLGEREWINLAMEEGMNQDEE